MLSEQLVLRAQWLVSLGVLFSYPIRSHSAYLLAVERHFETLKESFPWDQVSKGKVIDVGGGSGHMSVSLARVR